MVNNTPVPGTANIGEPVLLLNALYLSTSSAIILLRLVVVLPSAA